MPISSGAGGRATRLHLPGGVSKQTYWPNNVNSSSRKSQKAAFSTSPINEETPERSRSASSATATFAAIDRSHSTSNLPLDGENQQEAPRGQLGGTKRNRMKTKHDQDIKVSDSSTSQRLDTAEKYKRIRNISRPSSHSTTSSSAIKYFINEQTAPIANERDQDQDDAGCERKSSASKMSSPDSSVAGDNHKPTKFSLASAFNLTAKTTNDSHSKNNSPTKSSSLLGSLITIGVNNQKANRNYQTNNNMQSTTMKRPANLGGNLNLAAAHYQTTATINQHNSQTSLNPSLPSSAFGISKTGVAGQTAASTSSSTANLHSLSSLHQRPTTTINKRFNLKYVKTLIVLLMSLDLLVTIFVHQFASHDEFSLAFTSSKLRFSLVNLILSAIWFIVLTAAILFDIYLILLVGCLVDIASFVLLLACSTIHFTQRIDYNTVSLASLLMLLFSIIVLHVYLLVMTSLTIYLMIAVKRRRKH